MAHWYESCPRCNQGRLIIMRRDADGGLYLHCEECEWAWDSPSQIARIDAGKLGIDYESEPATLSEIEAAGWAEFALHNDE